MRGDRAKKTRSPDARPRDGSVAAGSGETSSSLRLRERRTDSAGTGCAAESFDARRVFTSDSVAVGGRSTRWVSTAAAPPRASIDRNRSFMVWGIFRDTRVDEDGWLDEYCRGGP